LPIEGNATLATDKLRLATAATAMSDISTKPGRPGCSAGAGPFWWLSGSSAANLATPSERGDQVSRLAPAVPKASHRCITREG
jgi:hypothetical protein